MTNFRNLKVEINNQQPLDEVVRELERLGFKRGCWWSNFDNVAVIEACSETFHLVDYRCTDINKRFGELTTLTQLKEMK